MNTLQQFTGLIYDRLISNSDHVYCRLFDIWLDSYRST